MKRFKQVLFCLAAVTAVPMLFAAEPTISLTATPRYPWNGLVDLAFTIEGDDGAKYDTSFVAKDLVGNTNLTLKTLYKLDGKIANAAHEQLFPGAYNWVWDAPMDCSSRWVTYAGCAPTASAVLFSNVQLSDISEFYATHCGTAISDKTHRTKGTWIKTDGTGKSVQFSVSDGGYSKSVCMHFEQSGANVVGYVKWARYVLGEGHHEDDFDANSASKQNIATTEVMSGYGLCMLDARVQQSESSVVYDRVVVEGLSSEVSYTYSVKFNANGGSGTMANETLTYGVAKALTANTFTRAGYTFQGWATTSTGAVVYSDKQSVSNLTVTPNATVNLYAVWSDAVYMVIDLSGGASAKSYPVSYLSAVPSGGWSSGYKTTKLVLRKCKAGKYSMQKNRSVTLSKDFYIGVFEMTQKQYKLITGNTPPENDGDSRPLAGVSYEHIHGSSATSIGSSTVIGKLKTKIGLNVNLPTEAQWEYACRAGTSSDAAINKYGRYSGNTNDGKGGYTGKTTVGSYLPNQWGIYDMRGNVWEWCLDGWISDLGTKAATDPIASSDNAYYPVLRGGGYNHGEEYCTSYYRMYGIGSNGTYVPHGGNCGHGFRVCITMK